MNKSFIVIAAAAALAACNNSDQSTADPNAPEVNAAPVVLPPAIAASKIYRCKDNSLVYIDWLSDGSARVKTDKDGRSTPVKVGADGTPSLTGDATAATVTYNGQSCKS